MLSEIRLALQLSALIITSEPCKIQETMHQVYKKHKLLYLQLVAVSFLLIVIVPATSSIFGSAAKSPIILRPSIRYIFIAMDEASLIRASNTGMPKPYVAPQHLTTPTFLITHAPPRMAHNTATSSHQDLPLHKEQNHPAKGQNGHPGGQTKTHSPGFSIKLELGSSGSINSAKTSHTASYTHSPATPKGVPSFLEQRGNMKGSMFTVDSDYSIKNPKIDYSGPVEATQPKRMPRMSEQPDMKSSGIGFSNDSGSKIPAFLDKSEKKQKKAPYQPEGERPQSSKQYGFRNQLSPDSLSSSYGNMKKSKLEVGHLEQLDPAAEWVKKSWSKKKQKKISINDFEQIKDLGAGKYGRVYLARERKLNFVCALKVIEKKLLKEEEITEQFIRELKIQSFLNHPNIIRMYGFFDDSVNIYIILEVGTGGQLFKQIKKHQSMAETKVAGIMRQVCQAVNELHSHRIIHRDIKPENIVLSEGVVKLCDFGWSVYAGQTLRTTFCGTPIYVGPEILKGKEYDEKIDIWSLGVMAYEMLVGENPFKITKEEELIKIIKDEIKIPSYVQLTSEARDFIFCCLQKNPDMRSSIRELLHHSFFKLYPDKADKKVTL